MRLLLYLPLVKVKKQKGNDLAKKFTPKEEGQPLMVRDECKEVSVSS